MPPWAGYIRVSFVGGRSGDSFRSVDDQTKEIEAWAAREGVEVIILQAELDGKSTDAARPIMRQAIDGVRDGRYIGVVTAYLSRAARDLRLSLDLWHEVESAGGLTACATVNIDATTIEGRMTRNILASVDQAQREQLAAGFERQAASATERGIWQRRQTPIGYDRDSDTRRLVPNGDAARVRRAFRDRAAGRPLIDIAADLGMTTSGVRHLLQNRVYLGELRVRSYVNETAHDPIVSVDDFEAAQRARVTRRPRSAQAPALLAGLVRCAGCGHVMSRSSGGGNRHVYGCSIHKSAGRCPEPASITLARLDSHMRLLAIQELVRLQSAGTRDTSVADDLRARREAAKKDLATFLKVTGSAGLDESALQEGIQERSALIRSLEGELRDLTRGEDFHGIDDPLAFWDSLDVTNQGRVLRGLVEAVIVRRVGRGRLGPVADRVRILSSGVGLFGPKAGAESAIPLRAVWPGLDDPGVLRVQITEDGF